MKTVCIAGATGYLGRYLVAEYSRRGWRVHALVRNKAKAEAQGLNADQWIVAEATQRETLSGKLEGVDLVVSCLGITRQKEGLSYQDVDYQANVNLLQEALHARVKRFAHIHVLGAEQMPNVPMVAAKQAFVDELLQTPIAATIVSPSGFFSDMADFLSMAQSGRVYLFGDGTRRFNPIHGSDLALAAANSIEAGTEWLEVGGPDVFTHRELAELAFSVLNKPAKITRIPDIFRRSLLLLLPLVTPRHVSGPARFFLTALGLDLVAEPCGSHHLADHFSSLLDAESTRPSL